MSQFINTEADAIDEDPNRENEKKEKQNDRYEMETDKSEVSHNYEQVKELTFQRVLLFKILIKIMKILMNY